LKNNSANSATKEALSQTGWRELAQRIRERVVDHELLGRAAQLSYYFLLALFPLLIFLVNLLGYFATAGSQLRDSLLRYLATVMPYSAVTLVYTTLDEVTANKGGGKLSFSLLAALWVASSGMGAISDSLNVAFDVKETRAWWRKRLISIALTIALTLLIMAALAIVLYGGRLGDAIANSVGYGDAFTVTWRIVQWPIMLGFIFFTFNLIYYFAPCHTQRRWRWATPGAIIAVILWLTISFALRGYLHFFNSYSRTYGSLGALIVLMLWFYLTGLAVLIGGEINSVVHERARSHASKKT
jgi:membrane protein